MNKSLLLFLCVVAVSLPAVRAAKPGKAARAAEKVTLKVVKVDSEETAGGDNKGVNAADGNPDTFWHTQWQGGQPAHPHEIILQLDPPHDIGGLSYLPRQDGSRNGQIRDYEIYVSGDGREFGKPVKQGAFSHGKGTKFTLFDAKKCAFVKLVALSAVDGGPFTSAAEFGVILPDAFRSFTAAAEAVVPLAGKPFKVPSDPAAKKRLVQQIKDYMGLPPEMVRAHQSAADYPGVAPADSPRVTQEVTVTVPPAGKFGGWQSTGLYANAGEIVTVTPLKPPPPGVTCDIHIGCHSDEKFSDYFTDWARFPSLMRSFALTPQPTPVANAFGGPIFIQVNNEKEDSKAGGTALALRIANAVEAPRFVLGKTKPREWHRIRSAPAPMGELACPGLTLHLPSSMLRGMGNPTGLMEWWNNVVDLEDQLVAWPTRTVPERIVFERQMGGAWGHNGYPIMIDAGGAEGAADFPGLRKDGNWGIFHEIGHNHQSDQWTFSEPKLLDQGEVTVNFFSMWCMEKLVGKPPGTGHTAIEGEELFQHLADRFGKTPSDDAFEQLAPFVVLIRKYGSEALHQTLASYQASPLGDDVPQPDRQAEFVRRYSKNANADLADFFRKSGFAVSKKVQDELKPLPVFDYPAWRKEAKGK
jgi:hypothetical protein